VKDWPEGKQCLLQVHDELLLECPQAELEETARVVKAVMEMLTAFHSPHLLMSPGYQLG